MDNNNQRLIFLLEDQPIVRMALKDLMAELLPSDCVVKEFSALYLLEQACQIETPALVIADLSVLDAGPAKVFEFLITQLPEELPVIITTDNLEYQRLLQDQSRFSIFPKGADFEVLFDMVFSALRFSPA